MTTADERIINRLQRIYDAQGAGGAAFADITGEPTENAALNAALAAKVPTSRTVNGQALSGDVVVTGRMLDTAGAPDNGIGANGDYAFDDATKTIYGPKAGGVWPAGVVLGAPTAPYLVYTALLSQTGTDAPVVTVLQNTLSGAIVWAREDAGRYVGTLGSAFTANKTFVHVTNGLPAAASTGGLIAMGYRQGDSSVAIRTYDITGSTQDPDLSASEISVEVRVYP